MHATLRSCMRVAAYSAGKPRATSYPADAPPNWASAELTASSMAPARSALTWRTASGAEAVSSSRPLPPSSRQRCRAGARSVS